MPSPLLFKKDLSDYFKIPVFAKSYNMNWYGYEPLYTRGQPSTFKHKITIADNPEVAKIIHTLEGGRLHNQHERKTANEITLETYRNLQKRKVGLFPSNDHRRVSHKETTNEKLENIQKRILRGKGLIRFA